MTGAVARRLSVGIACTVAATACGKAPPRRLHRPGLSEFRALRIDVQPTVYALPNGLRVVLLPDTSSNLVSVDVRYEVGSVEDPPDKTGLAHVVEHLTFELGPSRPVLKDDLAGASLSYNAYTTWDETHYTSLALEDQLGTLLALEARRMSARCEQLSDSVFERELDVVRSELRQRSGVQSQVNELVRGAAYGHMHPYGRSKADDGAALDAMSLADVCRFIERYYAPERAVLVVTGHFDREAGTAAVAEAFAKVVPRRTPPRPHVPPAAIASGESQHVLAVRFASAHIVTAVPVFSDREGVYGTNVRALFEGIVGDELRDLPYVTSFSVNRLGGPRAPLDVASITVNDPARLASAVEAFYEHRDAFAKDLNQLIVSLQAQRNAAALIRGYESISARGEMLADYVQYGHGVLDLALHVAWIRDSSVHEVGKRAVGYFARARSHVCYVRPSEDETAVEDEVAANQSVSYDIQEWNVPIEPGEHERDLTVPQSALQADVRQFTLDNGMHVMLAPSGEYPLIDVRLMFPVGSLHEPANRPGLAELTASLLTPNYQQRFMSDDARFLLTVLGMGGQVSVEVTERRTTFRMQGLSIYADGLVWQLGWLVERGRLAGDVLERYRKRLERLDDDETRRAHARVQAIGNALFGPAHPFAQTMTAVEQAQSLRLGDMRAFRRKHYRADQATLVVSGNFYAPDIEARIRTQYGRWRGKRGKPTAARTIPIARKRSGEAHFGHVDDATSQVWIAMAYATAPGSEDLAAREVLQEMLRLRMDMLREDLASTYGITVSQSYSTGPGLLTIRGAIDRDRSGTALVAMRGTLASMRRGEQAAATFARARRIVLRRALAQTLSSGAVANHLIQVAMGKRTLHGYTEHANDIARVRLSDVQTIVDEQLRATDGVVFLSGSRGGIAAAYATAGIRDVVYLD